MAWGDPTGLVDITRDRQAPISIRAGAALAFLVFAAISLISIFVVTMIILAMFGVVGGE